MQAPLSPGKPGQALEFLSQNARRLLLLETCVSFGETEEINLTREPQSDPTQAYSGIGCRPTRTWLYKELQRLFEYVLSADDPAVPARIPAGLGEPGDAKGYLQRAVFVRHANGWRIHTHAIAATPANTPGMTAIHAGTAAPAYT